MTSTIKVDNIQDQDGNNIINENANTITIGASGDTVTLASGASQTGFGRTGTVDWDTTAKTASFTAVSGNGYFVNTTSGAVTVTLPAGSAGSIVSLKDYANTWQTNNVTVTPNGTDKINGINGDASLSTEDQSVTLVYVDSTQGWRAVQDSTSTVSGTTYISATGGTIVTCGDYKIHTFTSPGTFCVSAGQGPLAVADYLVVAGGGGGGGSGGNGKGGGGGGAGGFRLANTTCMPAPQTSPLANSTGLSMSPGAFPITIGSGGAGGTSPTPGMGSKGSDSIFSTITSTGGGLGSRGDCGQNGGPGGSGGGTGAGGTGSSGVGNTPSVSPPQGNAGGGNPNSSNEGGAGGGGATAVGGDTTTGNASAGPGGAGGFVVSSGFAGCNGTNGCFPYGTNPGAVPGARYFSGGGGGGSGTPPNSEGYGGIGGGGDGACRTNTGAVAGGTNTGGGGGGGNYNNYPGASGGSGIVIIRYKFQ